MFDNYIIVKLEGKKTKFHYAGQIGYDDNEQMIIYLKRDKLSFNFIFQNDQVSAFPADDIVRKLPNPLDHGGMAHLASHLSFPVN